MTTEVTIPSAPKDRQKLKTMLAEMTYSMQRLDDEREAKKEIADEICSKFSIPKKIVNKLAATMYKRNYADLQAENEDFELLYETLVETKVVTEAA